MTKVECYTIKSSIKRSCYLYFLFKIVIKQSFALNAQFNELPMRATKIENHIHLNPFLSFYSFHFNVKVSSRRIINYRTVHDK